MTAPSSPFFSTGIATPVCSQEKSSSPSVSSDSDMDSPTHEVEWIDTDVSEDEDYIPQNQHQRLPSPPRRKTLTTLSERKRSRVHSASDNVEQLVRRRLQNEAKLPMNASERVRRTIDAAVGNGADQIDLSHMGLMQIPDEIAELQYIIVLRKHRIRNASLKLFLYGNLITHLSPSIFMLKNLSVLSLRNNRLVYLPPEIALLENLIELSVGNNLLKSVPAEILRLPRLTIASFLPNPLEAPPEQSDSSELCIRRRRQWGYAVPTLVEIASRSILASGHSSEYLLPWMTDCRLNVPPTHVCFGCAKRFCTPSVQEIQWRDFLGAHNIPMVFRFCSLSCADKEAVMASDSLGAMDAS